MTDFSEASFVYRNKKVHITSSELMSLGALAVLLASTGEGETSIKNISKLKTPRRIVDVGAHIGAYSILFAFVWPEAEILAIEPSKENYPHLVNNVTPFDNISPRKLAVSSNRGSLKLGHPLPTQKPRVARLGRHSTGWISAHGEGDVFREIVPSNSLDNILENRVDLIKVDIEGHEIPALIGAKDTIDNWRPLILMECCRENQKMAGRSLEELLRYLPDMHGYVKCADYGRDSLFAPREMWATYCGKQND